MKPLCEIVVAIAARYTYAVLFTAELAARLLAFGLNLFLSEDGLWSMLDLIIVGSSLWDLGVDIAEAVQQQGGEAGGFAGVSSLKAFRVVRITRIVKAVRLMRIFRFVMALRTLITSIFHTLKSLFWALILLTIIVYVFAILFVQAGRQWPCSQIWYQHTLLCLFGTRASFRSCKSFAPGGR